ncbi:MAG: VTT domain-containing protein [Anaerolineae bacterium]|nr:VTT domain-containing protein [Anaerolineae bacterium]
MTTERRQAFTRGLALLVVIAISVYIFTLPEEQAARLEAFGYPGVFLLAIISNATVLLPAPYLFLIFSLGARFDPFWVAVAAGAGAALGELSGYLAGFGGQAIIARNDIYQRMVLWMEKNGPLTVLLLAFIPNPFFDLTGIAAGALKMPLWKFLTWCFIGKIFKMLLFTYAGAGAFSIPFMHQVVEP